MNRGISTGKRSPLRSRLEIEAFVSKDIAKAVESDVCLAIEYYEDFDVEVEKESYPKIKRLAEDLLKVIEKTKTVEIYARRNHPSFKAFLKWTIDYAGKLSQKFPPLKKWKKRNRAPTLAIVIAKTLDANKVKLSKDENKTFATVVRIVFESLEMPCKDVSRILPKALKALNSKV
jgi:hypothetical protein